jgi:hypothetical protein
VSQHSGGLQEQRDDEPRDARDSAQQSIRLPASGGPRRGGPGWLGSHRRRVIGVATAIVAVLVGAGAYVLTSGGQPAAPTLAHGSPGKTLPGPFRVMSVTPAAGTTQADGSQPIQVALSAPVAAGSLTPTVSPHVAGSWGAQGDTLVFTPAQPLSPSTTYTVTVPAGARSSGGSQLSQPTTTQFTTEPYSMQRLAELLSQLGYLPMSWQQPYLGMTVASAEQSVSSLADQETLAYNPPTGVFSWQQGYPASLASQWQPDTYNVILRGAVMAFQSQHNMNIDGDLTSVLWNTLFQADLAGQGNSSGYTYAVASKSLPETLTIWHDGQVVLTSDANTGGAEAPTVDGTFPVYEKFQNQIMSGTNPDGSHYADPVSWVSYFNGGDAVHYFPRGSYGFPQSLGCVELPYSAAQSSFPYLTYGSLVTVSG